MEVLTFTLVAIVSHSAINGSSPTKGGPNGCFKPCDMLLIRSQVQPVGFRPRASAQFVFIASLPCCSSISVVAMTPRFHERGRWPRRRRSSASGAPRWHRHSENGFSGCRSFLYSNLSLEVPTWQSCFINESPAVTPPSRGGRQSTCFPNSIA